MRERLLNARLLRLLFLQRVSAAIAYHHRTGFVESQRRLLTLIGNHGGLTSAELVALTGSEKAQVSRTVAALNGAGLIEREGLRSRITLSEKGVAAFERILDVARARNADFTKGISEQDRAWFLASTAMLTRRAIALLGRERESESAAGEARHHADPLAMPARLEEEDEHRPMAEMIAPLLVTFLAYVQRSATIAYRRDINLSNFQSRVLSQVGEYTPVPLLRLVELVDRDKSQVGRSVDLLEEQGLVVRAPARGRAILIEITPAGEKVYADMCRIAVERDDYLTAAFGPDERDRYVALVDRLTVNAEAVLAAEQAKAG